MEIGAKVCNLHGYPDELGACSCGEVKLSGEPLGDLKGEVHPIFAADNWPLEDFESKEGKKVWKRIEPALQLATRFLLSKAGLAFFRHVRLGEEGAHAEDQGCDRNYLAYDGPSSERNKTKEEQIVIKDLEKLAKRIKCVFSVFFLPDKPDDQIHAMVTTSRSWFGKKIFIRGDHTKLPRAEEDSQVMMVNEAYKVYAAKQNPTPCEYVCFAFKLAFSVAHETAHASYMRDGEEVAEDSYKEPYYDLEQHNGTNDVDGALGYALENMLFRDKVSTFNHHMKGIEMQCEPVVKDMVDSHLVHRESLITFPVNPVWLKCFLTQSFWDEVDKKSRDEQLEAFYPPKGLEAMVKDPKDKIERWAVREGAEGGKRSRNYKIARKD
jgi:hypothetical protein